MLYFFYGDEEYLISQEIKRLKASLDENFIEMAFKLLDNPKFVDLVATLRTPSMMFGKTIICINCEKYLTGKKKSEDSTDTFGEDEIKQLSFELEACKENSNIDFIFCAYVDSSDGKTKIDKRKKIFKVLSNSAQSKEFIKIPTYKNAEYESWIINRAKARNIKLTQDVASQLFLQVGADLRLLDSEIEKLKVYAGDNLITKNDVEEICVSNEDVFDLVDYLATNNQSKAIEEYQKLITKRYPLAILTVMQTMIHSKIQLKAKSKTLSQDELAKFFNMHPYRVKLELQKLKNTSLRTLVQLKQNLTEAEYKIRSGQSLVGDEKEVEYAILR